MSKETMGNNGNYTDEHTLLYPTVSDGEQVSTFNLSEAQKLVAWNSDYYSNWMSNIQDTCLLSIQYPYHGGKNQLWRIITKNADSRIIKIQSVNSDKFIDVPDQSTKNEVAIMQWPGNDTCAQEFRLMKTSLFIGIEEGDSR